MINTFYFSIEGYVTVETLTNSFFPVNYSTCVFGYRPVILTDNCKINNVLIIKLIGYLGEYMRLFLPNKIAIRSSLKWRNPKIE